MKLFFFDKILLLRVSISDVTSSPLERSQAKDLEASSSLPWYSKKLGVSGMGKIARKRRMGALAATVAN